MAFIPKPDGWIGKPRKDWNEKDYKDYDYYLRVKDKEPREPKPKKEKPKRQTPTPPPPPPPRPKPIYVPPKPIYSYPSPPPRPSAPPSFKVEKQVEVTKYEYVYGIKDLRISSKEYAEKAIYVSKPIVVEGNVIQVGLDAVEDHPVFQSVTGNAPTRQTSVEYYISYVDNPSLQDWYPILPEGQKEVTGERLLFDTARTAALRFPAMIYGSAEPVIYKNGEEISPKEWAFIDGGRKIQLLSEYNPRAIYTISYTPNADLDNPWTIDVIQKGVITAKQTDVFKGTDSNNSVVLSKYPYINYELINGDEGFDPNTSSYKPIEVALKEGNIIGPNRQVLSEVFPYHPTNNKDVYTYNVTNYKSGVQKRPKPYSLDPANKHTAFEYIHVGNKLYFTERFRDSSLVENTEVSHGDATIEVTYDYLITNFRIKIILRNNSLVQNSVSPIVHRYALKFKVMK